MEHTEERLHTSIRKLLAVAHRVSLDDREDLVQEALARALKHGVEPDELPWLSTVLRRIAIDRARAAREYASGAADELDPYLNGSGPGPEDATLSNETCEEIRRALDDLPERYREALIVFAEEGRPAGLADRLGLSPSATWTLLSRARSRLRRRLESAGIVPAGLAIRFGRWKELMASGGVAVGAAVTIAVTASAPPPADVTDVPEPPRVVAASVEAPIETEPPTPQATPATAPEPRSQEPPAPTEPPARFEQDVEACAPGPDDGPRTAAGLRFENDEDDATITEEVVRRVPEPLRETETTTGRCEE